RSACFLSVLSVLSGAPLLCGCRLGPVLGRGWHRHRRDREQVSGDAIAFAQNRTASLPRIGRPPSSLRRPLLGQIADGGSNLVIRCPAHPLMGGSDVDVGLLWWKPARNRRCEHSGLVVRHVDQEVKVLLSSTLFFPNEKAKEPASVIARPASQL